MELGVCYYPEHWPRESWQPDAERMRELGLSWVRIGEFAWSKLESKPGQLDFEWLDHALDVMASAGLKVVLGTPTATPPKWLVDRYDDVLPVGADGKVRGFGSRRHYCFNSENYLIETERIVHILAERYGEHEAVQAWQTDNEYGCHDTVRCYCRNCRQAFRDWLEDRYGTTERLNQAWWNAFWSMEYRDFKEVELPNLTVTEANPSHSLDYFRFASDSLIRYNRLQIEIIKAHSPGRPITHNAMIYFGDFDHFKFAADLDILTWDNYPLGMLEQSPLPAEVKERYLRTGHPDLISLMHDLYRGAKDKPFWVMEQQPGQVNWAPSNPLPAKGAVCLWSHQAFAHGAEVVSYFRWRAAAGAQELMHAGLNHSDGSPDRASQEAAEVADDLQGLESGPVRAEVALLFDYENLWATELQPHAEGWNYWALVFSYYHALRALGQDVDIIHPSRSLKRYKVALAPALHLVDDALAGHLNDYLLSGGHLALGPRSGAKTLSNLAQARMPGPLTPLMGVEIRHVDALRPGLSAELGFGAERFRYHTWADLLTPLQADVLGTYLEPAYDGAAALCRNAVGKGRCYSLGMWGDDDLHRAAFNHILVEAGLEVSPMPEGVRLSRRGSLSYRLDFSGVEVTMEQA